MFLLSMFPHGQGQEVLEPSGCLHIVLQRVSGCLPDLKADILADGCDIRAGAEQWPVRNFLRNRHKEASRGSTRFSDAVVFGALGVLRLRDVHLGRRP